MSDSYNRRMENLAYNAWDNINELVKIGDLPTEYRKQLEYAKETLFELEKKHRGLWVKNEHMYGWSEDE